MSKDIYQIIERLDAASNVERFILATVIDLKGSGYRLPGAKMLITENGDALGTVSGGCLEADVLERARKVVASRQPEILTYDTTGKDDSVFSLNMGCRGIVRILLEEIDRTSAYFENLKSAFITRSRRAVVTIISGTRSSMTGAHGFYSKGTGFQSAVIKNAEIEKLAAQFFEDDRVAQVFELEDCEVFIENIDPTVNLIIFGGGFDALPLAEIAKTLGWRVEIADHRPAYASRKRFAAADSVFAGPYDETFKELVFDRQTVAVLMTHNYEKDREILELVLQKDLRYVGILGPRARTERLLGEVDLEKRVHENLFGPVGLDIGADSPELIAISIIAEINSVLNNRGGGFLRNRSGSIYSRNTG